jgi:Cu/Ag efflux protein CusF
MRTLVAALSAAALIGMASAAYAATAAGTIKSIDAAAKTVTLKNGKTFTTGTGVRLSDLKVGEKVNVTYTGAGSNMDATAIVAAS